MERGLDENVPTSPTRGKKSRPSLVFASAKQTKAAIRARVKQITIDTGMKAERDPLLDEIESAADGFYPNIRFGDRYDEGEVLGEGTVGTVKICTEKATGKQYAVKVVRTSELEIILQVKNEFVNLKRLDHPNVIKVFELFYDATNHKIHLVMEYCRSKEMFDVLQDLGKYSEIDAITIYKQVIKAIQYLHSQGVCHRDLKPNNILVSPEKDVKIVDFNVAKFSDKYKDYSQFSTANYQMLTYTGTIAFSAPEIFGGGEYTEAVDMWSAGVVLYTMLAGYQPFSSEYVKDLIDQICNSEYSFEKEPWELISSEAKEFIKKCLKKNPKERMTPTEALEHPFLSVQQHSMVI